jgi:hypothetical protein
MIDAEANSARKRAQRNPSPQRDSNHPLPMWPMAHISPEPGEIPATEHAKATAGPSQELNEAVSQLSGALRTTKRAHRAYLAELRLGDVEPAEDWSTWYAEYLLGLR